MGKPKYTKIGAVLKSKNGNQYAILGNTKANNTNYNYDVKVQVTNGKGEKVQVKNPRLMFFDPRKSAKGAPENLPDYVLFDLTIVEDTDGPEELN